MNDQDLNLIAEAKREIGEAFKERMLEAFAIAHHQVSEKATEALKATTEDGSKGGAIVGVAAMMLIMSTAADVATAVLAHLGVDEKELAPAGLRKRYETAKREGRVK